MNFYCGAPNPNIDKALDFLRIYGVLSRNKYEIVRSVAKNT
jgi:hypothetical protein